jgi:von Willebrand factor type A domain-containing protein
MSVTPSTVNLVLAEGQSTTVNKVVDTPPIPPNPDIVFLVDTTQSMDPVITNVQTNIGPILSTVLAAQPNSQFAVAMYKDSGDPVPFAVLQDLTADTAAVQTGINNLAPALGGGDIPEDQINALFQVATGAISFRPNGTRIVLWIGDSSSHDPSNGHTLTDAISALQAAQVKVIALAVSSPSGDGLDRTGQATAVTGATGGQLFTGIKPDEVSNTILAGLHNLPVTVQPVLALSDPLLAVSFNPGSETVTSGTNATFVETISVSPAARPGSTLVCQVDFLLNGHHQDGFTQVITDNVPKHTSALEVSDATSDFHDPGTLKAVLTDGVTKAPIPGATVSFTMQAESGSGVTDASGLATCTIIPSEPAGVYPIVATFAGDAEHLGTTGTGHYTVTREETTTEYTGPTVLANGSTVNLTAVLKEDGVVPISGRTLTFTLGTGVSAQSGTGITDGTGTAQWTVTVNQPLGAGTVSASFAGDPFYEPSADSKPTLIFAFAAGGSFVIGDRVPGATVGTAVTFWGAQWDKLNTLTGGAAPASFKGFEDSAKTPACGTQWTTSPGNSAPPPASIPSFLGVIVASSIRKSGPAIQGDSVHIVVVKTDPGYAPNPGHAGTGTIVGIFC